MATVTEYKSEFVVLANRVTGISESLLTSFYISGLKLALQIDLLRARPKTLGEAFALARITEARFEDDRATTIIAKPNDLKIAVQVQDIKETTLHTSDKVEAVSTCMVVTYEEHRCQDGFCRVATYEEQECQDGLKSVTTRSSAGKKGDLGAITSKGGPPDHMRASEKELVVLKSPLEQKSMFRRQERMLRRQEQQRIAKDAKIQRRIWDHGIKSIQDNTLRGCGFEGVRNDTPVDKHMDFMMESKGPEERTANKSDKNTGVAYIDLETENRCSSPPSMNISHDDFEQTVIAETPNYNEPLTVKKDPINEAYYTTVDVKPIDAEESKSWFTKMKNSKVTKINSKGSNGAATSQVATRINKCAVPTKKYDCSLLKTESKGPEERTANKNDKTTRVAYIDLETENRCSSLPSMNISHDDFKPTVAKTPNYNEPLTVKNEPINEAYSTTVESVSEVDFFHSTIIQTSFPHQQLPHSFTSPCSTSASALNTPKKQHISHNRSPLYSSVNSHVHKRRKSSPPVTVKMDQYDSPDPKTPKEINKFSVPQSCILDVPEASSTTSGDVTKKELKISCSLCRNPLGLVENNYFVSCSVTSLSMVHLATIWKGIAMGHISVPVVVYDIASVNRRILERTLESGIGQGIWSKEDGCVFNTIFCTFCNNQDSCLGLHVVATDSANVQFLNKLLFYSDRLEIQHIEASMNSKEVSPSSVTSVSKGPVQGHMQISPSSVTSVSKGPVPLETNSSGWRTTKSKMRLPQRVQVSTAKH
ncbi:hypothetical protein Tco_0060231 [Tanacetum coccineum]